MELQKAIITEFRLKKGHLKVTVYKNQALTNICKVLDS